MIGEIPNHNLEFKDVLLIGSISWICWMWFCWWVFEMDLFIGTTFAAERCWLYLYSTTLYIVWRFRSATYWNNFGFGTDVPGKNDDAPVSVDINRTTVAEVKRTIPQGHVRGMFHMAIGWKDVSLLCSWREVKIEVMDYSIYLRMITLGWLKREWKYPLKSNFGQVDPPQKLLEGISA